MENKEDRPTKQEIDMLERMIRDQSANGRKDKDKAGEREQDKKPDNPGARSHAVSRCHRAGPGRYSGSRA